MKEGHISFKFKSENKLDTVKFHGESIYIKDLKVLIAEARKLGQINSELIIYDERLNEIFENEKKISTNSVVVVERRTPDTETNLLTDDKIYNMMYDNSEERKANGGNPAFPRTNQPFYNNRNSETGGYRHMNRPYQSYGNNHVQHPPPIPSDIADILNNAKYFIIKSGNLDNIDLARKFSTWATTLQNQRKLNEAFTISPNVILIFSVNKSSKFQGFARMESLISNDQSSSPFWKDTENIKLGGCFKIKWLRYSDLSFNKIAHLRNRFNNNEPIKKSRDTQEIPLEIGREICSYFEIIENPLLRMDDDNNPGPYNYENQEEILPIRTSRPIPNPIEIAPVIKANDEDDDDVDRFIKERENQGINDDQYNEIKEQILNQSKDDEMSIRTGGDESLLQRKKSDNEKDKEKEGNTSIDLEKNKVDSKEENSKKPSPLRLEEKAEGKQEDFKNDRNNSYKAHGQLGYYPPRNGGAYPPNYMYYYNPMWNPYMNYYGNNLNPMRMSNYYYNYNMIGGQNPEMKNELEELDYQGSDKKKIKQKNSSSKERERRKNKDSHRDKSKSSKPNKDKKSTRHYRNSESRSRSRSSSRSKQGSRKKK